MDTEQLKIINTIGAYFIVREKCRMSYAVVEDKQYNNPKTGVVADQTIRFTGYKTKKQYKDNIRRIVFYDHESNTTFVFYTNNFEMTAENIALAYKYRWRVGLLMVQAASACEGILWHIGERNQDTTLFSHHSLLLGRNSRTKDET